MKRFVVLAILALPASAQISVITGSYGSNVNPALRGNDSSRLAAACNGKPSCSYLVQYQVIGDPAPGQKKDYVSQWMCGATVNSATVPPEATGFFAVLSCETQPTPAPTATPVLPTPTATAIPPTPAPTPPGPTVPPTPTQTPGCPCPTPVPPCATPTPGGGTPLPTPTAPPVTSPTPAPAVVCQLQGAPVQFEPNPPGTPRPPNLSSGFSSNLLLFAPNRLLMQESFGYSILDISNPIVPTAIYYTDIRNPVGGPNSIPQHGDGQNMVQTISVSPDGLRAAFSTTGPAAPFNTVAGSLDPSGITFTLWGDFMPDRANSTVIQRSAGRYIAYDIHGSLVSAADITTLPQSLGVLNVAAENTGWPGGYLGSLAGNYLVYMGNGAVQIALASSPGPIGSITAAYPRTTLAAADFGGRAPAFYTATPSGPNLLVLVELNAKFGENSPSYCLVTVTPAMVKTVGAIWRVPSAQGENWFTNPGPSSIIIGDYIVMWAQRSSPSTYRAYSATVSGWPGTPGYFDVPQNVTPGQPMKAFQGGGFVYAYLPTGPSAFVLPMKCQ